MSDINIGALSEAINDKMDRDLNNRSDDSGLRKLVESYVNGTDWYKVFDEIQSDGTVKKWCEQGGCIGTENTPPVWEQHTIVVTYLKPLNTEMPLYINICASSGTYTGRDTSNRYGDTTTTMTNTGFTLNCNQYSNYVYWKTEGYIS